MMVGAGNSDVINSTNIFAALDNRRRKSSKKDKKSKEDSKPQPEKTPQFWAPAPVTVKSWADVDDDDDYFATAAPPPPVWGAEQSVQSNAGAVKDNLSHGEESEGEDIFEEADDDVEEEHEIDTETAASPEKAVKTHLVAPPLVSKEPERQLSKKELKKKELAELDAVLEELGLALKETKEANGCGTDAKLAMNSEDANGEVENKDVGPALSESKNSKRRKAKKEKSFKEPKDGEDQAKDGESGAKDGESDQLADADSSRKEEEQEEGEANAATVDPKERLKKLASFKKKKSGKEVDAAAKAAAAEAAARAAKLASAKKKEKNHYNQQPVR